MGSGVSHTNFVKKKQGFPCYQRKHDISLRRKSQLLPAGLFPGHALVLALAPASALALAFALALAAGSTVCTSPFSSSFSR